MIPEDTMKVATGTPTFESKAAQDYVDAYDKFINNYKTAVGENDRVKIQELSNEMIELSAKGTEALKGLSTEDATKLTEYMQGRSQDLAKLQTLNK